MSPRFAFMQTTRTGLRIGCAYVPTPPAPPKDGERLQAALLEPRTKYPVSLVRRVAGAVWGWL